MKQVRQKINPLIKKLTRLPRRVWIIAGIAALVVAALTYALTAQPATPATPQHKTILPEGSEVEELGGWSLVSPPENDPVFAYADNIDGIAISVSQQPLPESFKADRAKALAELAKAYSATSEIKSGTIKAYAGTSSKGPQSVLFIKDDLLIMIKSQQKVSDASWADYIATLK